MVSIGTFQDGFELIVEALRDGVRIVDLLLILGKAIRDFDSLFTIRPSD